MRRQHMEEAREAVQGTYPEVLQKLNALIASGRCRALMLAGPWIEFNKTLTAFQKQYILNKVESACHEYRQFLWNGWRFVWQLPAEMRDGSAYMDTFRYIRYLPTGPQQFKLLLKLTKMVRHENTSDFLKSGYKETLYHEIRSIFLNYCIKIALHGM